MRDLSLAERYSAGCLVMICLTGVLLWLGVSGYLFGATKGAVTAGTLFITQPATWVLAGLIFGLCSLQFAVIIRLGRVYANRMIEQNWDLAGEKVVLNDTLEKAESKFVETLRAMATAVDVNDQYQNGHSERVAGYAMKVGRELGLSQSQLAVLNDAAMFHDLGRIWIPTYVLHKEAPLLEDERTMIRMHPVLGAELLSTVTTLQEVAEIVRCHHERFDGRGYPAGLKGSAIPLESRILAVADSFEAMTSERPYRPAMLLRDALEELCNGAGGRYDPRVVEAFMNIFEDIASDMERFGLPKAVFGSRLASMIGNC